MPNKQESTHTQEPQKSEFAVCLNGMYELVGFNGQNSEILISKLNELEIIYNKRIDGFKSIIQGQREFHYANNKLAKESDKAKNALTRELQAEVQNLKDALSIYQKIEFKYADAVKQLNDLKKNK